MRTNLFLLILIATFPACSRAQDSARDDSSTITFSAYIEAYHSFDFGRPENHQRPPFLYNFNRHQEFNINLGLLRASYTNERTRATLSAAFGTYMNANYANEPGVLRNVFEANAGYRVSRNRNLWFDIGILPSHIGFESAIGKDNWTLSRSLVAENTPYFETGARVSYGSPDEKWMLAALILNGWQRITRQDGNSAPAFGTQVSYRPTSKLAINYSTFVGSEQPDSLRRWRYHQNLYGIIQLTEQLGLTVGFDLGLEQREKRSQVLNKWMAPVAILRFKPNDRWAIALRGEYIRDRNGIIFYSPLPNRFSVSGSSVNVDYAPIANILLRLEGRYFHSRDLLFDREGQASPDNTAINFSTAFSF